MDKTRVSRAGCESKTMKVVMIHDCANVGHELIKELKNFNIEINQFLYYDKKGITLSKLVNIPKLLLKIKNYNPDLIHAHYLGYSGMIAKISGRKYIIHVHGSDVRNKTLSFFQEWVLENAICIVYSTPDLKQFLSKRAIYLQTPIGNQFINMKINRVINDAFRPVKYEKNMNFYAIKDLDYKEMPLILNRIKIFHDRKTIKSLSKTALEALACGCKVIDFNGNQHIIFPEKHRADNVAFKLYQIYKCVLYDS